MRRRRRRPPPSPESMPWICEVSSSMPGGARISMCGCVAATSMSISRSSSPFAQLLAEVLAGRVIGLADPLADEDVEDAVFGRVLRARAHAAHRLLARLLHADLDQIAHDRVHVTADVADLGELRSFDLDEQGIGKPRQTARDLRLAHAGRADHQNVLRRDLRAHRLGDLLAPPATQRDRHGLAFPWPTMNLSSSWTIS